MKIHKKLSLLILPVLLGACNSESSKVSVSTTNTIKTPSKIISSGFNVQKVCPSSLTCGFMKVPLDYQKPEGDLVEIFYGVRKAENPERRIGTLMFNFGGPGDAGVKTLSNELNSIPVEIRQRFDLVSFDPRGTGFSSLSSDLRACLVSEPLQDPSAEGVQQALLPQAQQWADKFNAALTRKARDTHTLPYLEIAKRCRSVLNAYAPYLGSNSVVQDMDKLRLHLGESSINFIGVSYGTRLGALYADRYPQNIRALILDSNMDPAQPDVDQVLLNQSLGQNVITQRLLSAQYSERLTQINTAVTHQGVYVANDGAKITPDIWALLLDVLLTKSDGVEQVGVVLEALLRQDLGVDLVDYISQSISSDEVLEKLVDAPHSASVMCTDSSRAYTLADLDGMADDFEQSSVSGAGLHAQAYMCADWTARRDPIPQLTNVAQKLTAQQKVLIIGGSLDHATPFAWSKQMKATFGGNAFLVEQSGVITHGFSFENFPCVDNVAVSYLLDPASLNQDRVCQANFSG